MNGLTVSQFLSPFVVVTLHTSASPLPYLCIVLFLLDYLCPKSANTFGIEFVRFKVRDMESQQVLFEIAKPEEPDEGEQEGKMEGEEEEDVADGRFIRYEFPPQVLQRKTLGAT